MQHADARNLHDVINDESVKLVLISAVLDLYEGSFDKIKEGRKQILSEVNRVLEPNGVIAGGFGLLDDAINDLSELGLENVHDFETALVFKKKGKSGLDTGSIGKEDAMITAPASDKNMLVSMPSKKKGGIDFNPSHLDLQTQGAGTDFDVPLDSQVIQNIQTIDGFTPVIFNIAPVTNLPLLLGVADQELEDRGVSYNLAEVP